MMKHIVVIKFKPTVSDAEIKEVFQKLEGLRKPIPEIKAFTYGRYSSDENLNQNYNYGFEITFDNAADRDIYLHHPEHVKVAEYIIPLLEDGFNSLIAFDYDPDAGL